MNVLKPNRQTTVITLIQSGVSQHEIHRKTGIDRKTIRKYAAVAGQWPGGGISNSPMATGSAMSGAQIPPPRPPGRAESADAVIPAHARSACEPHREWIEEQVRLTGNSRQKVIEEVILAKHPTKEFVRADQIAAFVVLLCSEAGASTTGSALQIDAGWTAV